MIGVCFKYDPGYDSLLRDQFYELAKAFPNINIYERNVHEDEPENYNDYPINKVNNADDLPTEPRLVVLTGQNAKHIQGNINLDDYVHPENAIYFFGDDHSHLTQEIIGQRTDYDKVYININQNIWSSQAVAMVLYDRKIKMNG